VREQLLHPVDAIVRELPACSVSSAPDLFSVKPLEDPRWARFLAGHPGSSVFHTVEWLSALQRTYQYEPIAFTTSPPERELQNAVTFCDVKSWLTRRRLVGLPFSDCCDLLVDGPAEFNGILSALQSRLCGKQFAYIEIRSAAELDTTAIGPHSVRRYCGHKVDLTPDLSTLYKNLHRSSAQRKIRRAEREGLTYQAGKSPFLLNCFYNLLILTRRRHGVPPQPKRWFEALIDSLGENLEIRVAFKNAQPVAAILTLRHKDTALSKYACSDARLHNLGGMHLLYWQSIVGAKLAGMRTFDLGRSDWGNTGLITFKDRWGAERASLNYLRLSTSIQPGDSSMPVNPDWKERAARMVFSHLSGRLLRIAGELIYPHIG
jgi:hypothetical protein